MNIQWLLYNIFLKMVRRKIYYKYEKILKYKFLTEEEKKNIEDFHKKIVND